MCFAICEIKNWVPAGIYCTVKFVVLLAVPPGVVTEILPVTAPTGTLVVICVSELTVNDAVLPENFTAVACRKLVPVRMTCVPTGPLVGAKLVNTGKILKLCSEVRFPPGSFTVMTPVVEPAAGLAVMNAPPPKVNVPAPAPKSTLVAVEKFCPSKPTAPPTFADLRTTG